ncbi:hypothetical protein UlMin_042740 [Ulmus minor]
MADRTLAGLFFLFLLLLTIPAPSESLSYAQYQTLFSLPHSLMLRVANLRTARGDFSGAERARLVAAKLERGLGLGFWRFTLSAGWDYARNYAWRDLSYSELYGVVSDANELLKWLGELTRPESDAARVAWVGRNYQNFLRVSKSMLRRLLKVFTKSGILREGVETVQREVVEGGLLMDCLELGSEDLKGLIQIFKDLAMQYVSTPGQRNSDL